MLWLSCLKEYTWRGDGEFDIALDKCGVPSLKNGDYTMNLAHDCLAEVVAKNKADDVVPRIYWEGNFYSETVEDTAELTMESIAVVAAKFANVLKSLHIRKGASVLLYAPNVVQLPVVLFACAKVGAALTFVNAAIVTDVPELTKIFEEAQPSLIVAVDGFFIGEELRAIKKTLDEVLETTQYLQSTMPSKVIVIGHTVGNPAVPPPTTVLPRRPSYSLQVPLQDGRDLKWSDLILTASAECDPEWLHTEDAVFNTFKKKQARRASTVVEEPYGTEGTWHVESYSVGQIALLVKLLCRSFEDSDVIWPFVDPDDLLFLSCIFAAPLAKASLVLV
ncbi:acetyl-coenzyme A synthetasecytoplasmic isoform 2 [Aphelenchoides avenae]|nr:acetyl-coenzyme A synthetasecytoplasmic isoform 2 [Aphelenchus avenae]